MSRSMRRIAKLACTFSALACVGACGNVTAGGLTARAEVILSGDAADPIPTAAILSAPTSATATAESMQGGDDTPEGELRAEFILFLEALDGSLVSLTDTIVRVRVDLEGVQVPEVADQVIPTGQYTALRMVFTEIEVRVDAGLIINGVPVTGEFRVDLENLTLPVSHAVSIDLGTDEVAELVIDLNAASWLQAVDPVTATVDEQVFADLVSVRLEAVRPG